MLQKNPPTDPDHIDFSSLDNAVSELSQQTAAILGENGEKVTVKKPTLPKKQSSLAQKGRSFDIIHHPKQTQLQSSLKSVTSKEAITAKSEEHPLLPDHAGLGFNEKPNLNTKESAEESAGVGATPSTEEDKETAKAPLSNSIISQHQGGSLSTGSPEEEAEPAATDKPEEPKPAVSHTSSVFEPLKDSKTEPAEKPSVRAENSSPDEVLPEVKSDPVVSGNESTEVAKDEPSAEGSGELFANNLLSETKKKGYQPHESQQKPTVFDTNEYHPELHDWSKLGHSKSPVWIILALLLVVAGGLAYMFISGT